MPQSEFETDTKTHSFIKTPFYQSTIERSIQYLNAGYPVHFVGPTGVGKTSLAIYIANQMNRPVTVIRGNHEMSNSDLLGGFYGLSKKEVLDKYIRTVYKKEQEIKPVWFHGKLSAAVKQGHTLIFDEFTRSTPETNNIFLSILEEGILPLYGNPKEPFLHVHPKFSVIFTSNPEEYAGVFKTQDALIDRLITIDLGYCDLESELCIIQHKTGATEEEAKVIAELVSRIRSFCLLEKNQGPSLRASIMIGTIAKKAKIPIDPLNELFQKLIVDVLWVSVFRCEQEMDKQSVREYILHLITKEKG